tara:strand:- start:5314 stop:6051 length:738 start_codon:yes stop_codon:yes gene_type:complete
LAKKEMTQIKTSSKRNTKQNVRKNTPNKALKRNVKRTNNALKKTSNKQSNKNKLFDIYLTILLMGLFFGVLMIVYFFPDHIIKLSTITKMILLIGIVLNLVALPLGFKKNKKGKTLISEIGTVFYILLNFFGGGVFITGLILMLNFAGRSTETHSEHYKFGGKDSHYRASSYSGVVYTLENNKNPEEVDHRWFQLKNISAITKKGFLEIKYSSGLFGIDVFEERGITSDINGSDYEKIPLIGSGY